MKKIALMALLFSIPLLVMPFPEWGFFGHRQINRLAVFTLPTPLVLLYKMHIDEIIEDSVLPDKLRYVIEEEGPRHYIDLDEYEGNARTVLPRYWNQAVAKFSKDTLLARGIVPWHIYRQYRQLKNAFLVRDTKRIIKISTRIGHYIADAHVPLHTTRNYNGQYSGQLGIHALWESRLPELYFSTYYLYVGRASYLDNVQEAAWKIVEEAHEKVDSVLQIEKALFSQQGSIKYGFKESHKQTYRVVTPQYAQAYHTRLNGMVERQLRKAIKMIGNVWYTAWVDGGQPDINMLLDHPSDLKEIAERQDELNKLYQRDQKIKARPHDE